MPTRNYTKVYERDGQDLPTSEDTFGALAVLPTKGKRGGLVLAEDGSLALGKFTVRRSRLEIADSVTQKEWEEFGGALRQLTSSLQWVVGDWLDRGEWQFGVTYETVAKSLGYKASSLRDWVYVCRNLSIRIDELTFGHHQVVVGMEAQQQQYWLKRAAAENLSISQLRGLISQKPPTLPDLVGNFQRKFTRMMRRYRAVGRGDRLQLAQLLRQMADELEGGE